MSKLTLPAAHLVRILSNVLPHTSNDGITKNGRREYWIPALSAVRLETDGAELLAVATDRYTIAVDRATLTDDAPAAGTFVALINRDDAAAMVKTLKDAKLPAHVLVTLTLDIDKLTMDRYGDYVTTYELVTADFPRWRALFPGDDEPTLVIGPVMFSVQHLVKFAKLTIVQDGAIVPAKDWNGHLTFRQQCDIRPGSDNRQCRPMAVAAGETFRAMVMPVRMATEVQTPAEYKRQLTTTRKLLGEQ